MMRLCGELGAALHLYKAEGIDLDPLFFEGEVLSHFTRSLLAHLADRDETLFLLALEILRKFSEGMAMRTTPIRISLTSCLAAFILTSVGQLA